MAQGLQSSLFKGKRVDPNTGPAGQSFFTSLKITMRIVYRNSKMHKGLYHSGIDLHSHTVSMCLSSSSHWLVDLNSNLNACNIYTLIEFQTFQIGRSSTYT